MSAARKYLSTFRLQWMAAHLLAATTYTSLRVNDQLHASVPMCRTAVVKMRCWPRPASALFRTIFPSARTAGMTVT